MPEQTRPCEYCGKDVTRTGKQQSQRTYWTCGTSCANRLRIKLGNVPGNWLDNPFRGQQETRPCGQCGEAVTRHLNPSRVDKVWFCSSSCRAKTVSGQRVADGSWKRPQKPRTGDTIPCEICGTAFYRQPAYIKQNRRFCSRACNAQHQSKPRIIKTCALFGCGVELSLRPSYGAVRYCCKAHESLGRIKRPLDRTHNGKPARKDTFGYVWLWEPGHPNNLYGGWQPEHRLVMEKVLGRYLTSTEQVDHIDAQKDNNDPSNLQVLNASDHGKKTNRENLGAIKGLRAQIVEYEAELAAAKAKLAELEP